jgi:hypothetical protein
VPKVFDDKPESLFTKLDWNGGYVDPVCPRTSGVLVDLFVTSEDFRNPSIVLALLLSPPLQSVLCLGLTEDRRERKEEYGTLTGETDGGDA